MLFIVGSAILGFLNAHYWIAFVWSMLAWGTWAWKMRLPSRLAVEHDPSLKLGFWGMAYHHVSWVATFVGLNFLAYLIAKLVFNGWK